MPRSADHQSTPTWRTIVRLCVADGVPKRSSLVALVVGVVLNVINQGDVMVEGGDVNVLKIALTFMIPYCVATYGAVSYQLTAMKAASGKAASAEPDMAIDENRAGHDR